MGAFAFMVRDGWPPLACSLITWVNWSNTPWLVASLVILCPHARRSTSHGAWCSRRCARSHACMHACLRLRIPGMARVAVLCTRGPAVSDRWHRGARFHLLPSSLSCCPMQLAAEARKQVNVLDNATTSKASACYVPA